MKNLLLILIVTFFCSCSNDSDSKINDFAGRYKLIAVVSETAVDLNNDELGSNDLLNELQSPHHVSDGVFDNFFNVDMPYYFAEVKSNGLISINYPYQEIQYLNNEPELPIFASYLPRFTAYSYELTSDMAVLIHDINPGYNNQFGEIQSVQRLIDDSFEATMTVNFYNFIEKTWIPINIKATYTKVQ